MKTSRRDAMKMAITLVAAVFLAGCGAAGVAPTDAPTAVPTAAPTDAPTPAPTANIALAKFAEYSAHIQDALASYTTAYGQVSPPDASNLVAWADTLQPLVQWADDEQAWLLTHPSQPCYAGAYDGWQAAVKLLVEAIPMIQVAARASDVTGLYAGSAKLTQAKSLVTAATSALSSVSCP
jgi:hypothetical protein